MANRAREFGIRPRGGSVAPVSLDEFRRLHSAHLRSEKWARIKARLFQKRGRKCERCGSDQNIHVHHKHYNNLGRERLRNLEILCRNCHAKHHGRLP